MEQDDLGGKGSAITEMAKRLTRALYEALDTDDEASVLGELRYAEKVTVDGRFNLTAVALRVVACLADAETA